MPSSKPARGADRDVVVAAVALLELADVLERPRRRQPDGDEDLGFGRVLALQRRPSASHQIH